MTSYLIIFILSLFCLIFASELVLITKKGLDRSFKFLLAAIFVFILTAVNRFLIAIDPNVNSSGVKYLDLLFIILFLIGLFQLKNIVRKVEGESIKQKIKKITLRRGSGLKK